MGMAERTAATARCSPDCVSVPAVNAWAGAGAAEGGTDGAGSLADAEAPGAKGAAGGLLAPGVAAGDCVNPEEGKLEETAPLVVPAACL